MKTKDRKRRPIEYVEDENGCFICTSHKPDMDGYPRIMIDYKLIRMNRFVYNQSNGDIPAGEVVRHTCNNATCINPNHLITGTQAENMNDLAISGILKGERNVQSRITEEDVIFIRTSDLSIKELMLKFGLKQTQLYSIRNYKAWKHVV